LNIGFVYTGFRRNSGAFLSHWIAPPEIPAELSKNIFNSSMIKKQASEEQLENTAPPLWFALLELNLLFLRVKFPVPEIARAPPSLTEALQLKKVEFVISDTSFYKVGSV